MNEKTSIIVVHKDQAEYLNIYLQSINVCSKENDYEIIIVDNNSVEKKSVDYLESLVKQEIKVIGVEGNYAECLMTGYEAADKNSDFLIFSHSDNVVLNPKWLDFFIGNIIENPNTGCLFPGPALEYIGINGVKNSGPNYNFIFTPRIVFEKVGKIKYCQNVGSIIGYQVQLQDAGLKSVMVSPYGFFHHFGLKSISQEDKNKDLEKLFGLLMKN